MFYIRADGNEKIGMGHVMRCLTIAEALGRLGEEVLFLTADEKPVMLIKERGFSVKVLYVRYDDMEAELPQTAKLLAENREAEKPKILVDSYFITPYYLEQLRMSAKVILMDDEKRAVYPCDGLVNYNIYGKTLEYEKDYPAWTKLFLGCAYMPLREQFRNCNYAVREKAEHVLFTTGGSDSLHIARCMVKRLLQKEKESIQNPVWHIVCGPYHPDTEELERLAAGHVTLQIHKNVTCMSELMQECDIAVSAAGSTFYELCSIGIPTVGFYFVENQRRNMETFAKLTPIKNAGDFSAAPESVLDFVEEEVEVLCREKTLREEISQIMKTIVDGRGADRLAKGLLSVS
ncbi:MAG: UDP-2,4-diacetamido-2,4,6-trideoxy-beta-L-altropyranose hydrolase [Lachnospiraceae bacterium]|nr:UDP-2,4-diacetamido-2,4,6-trideoxy-beta-L-altropyranose hydrolase [Lachnospiraceae bacterium]